jgi:hypothetical protein
MKRAAWVFAGALLLARPAARAEVCAPERQALLLGPLPQGSGPSDLGDVPAPCPANEIGGRIWGSLLIDEPDFYGAIAAGATLRGRYRVTHRWSLLGALDAVTWRMPVNAVVSSSRLDAGPATLGAQRAFLGSGRTVAAGYARVLLPLDTGRRHGVATGVELGASVARALGERWRVNGSLGLPATLVVVDGQSHGRLAPAALV